MPPVFGRDEPDPHPFENALAQLQSGPIYEKAVARNLMHDHRVSEKRDHRLQGFITSPFTGKSLRDGIDRYHKECIRKETFPDYVDPDLNGSNLHTGLPGGTFRLSKDYPLARIVDLTGLRDVLEWARRAKNEHEFVRMPRARVRDQDFLGWLDGKLRGASSARIEGFVAAALRAMNAYRKQKQPYQPSWATTWHELAPYLSKPPTRWLELMGVSKPAMPRWLIVLRYQAREAGTVAHPTVLDAGGWPFYFPSPPAARWGHPMDLSHSSPATAVLSEFSVLAASVRD